MVINPNSDVHVRHARDDKAAIASVPFRVGVMPIV